MAIFEFRCEKCKCKKEFFCSYKDSKSYESDVACECGGKHERIISQPAPAAWKCDSGTVSKGRQNLAETDKKGGGK